MYQLNLCVAPIFSLPMPLRSVLYTWRSDPSEVAGESMPVCKIMLEGGWWMGLIDQFHLSSVLEGYRLETMHRQPQVTKRQRFRRRLLARREQ